MRTQQCFMCGGYGYHAQQLIEPDPRHNEVSAMREAAEARKRSLEESVAALKEKTRNKVTGVPMTLAIEQRIRSHILAAIGPLSFEELQLPPQYAVKQGDRCPRCSTPGRLRQMAIAEIAATETAVDYGPWRTMVRDGVVVSSKSKERWEVAGRVCPDPKCARIFLEISGDVGIGSIT